MSVAIGLITRYFTIIALRREPESTYGRCPPCSYATSLAKIKRAVERISAFMQDLTEQNGSAPIKAPRVFHGKPGLGKARR